MELAAAVEAALRELTSQPPVEIRENGGRRHSLRREVRGRPAVFQAFEGVSGNRHAPAVRREGSVGGRFQMNIKVVRP